MEKKSKKAWWILGVFCVAVCGIVFLATHFANNLSQNDTTSQQPTEKPPVEQPQVERPWVASSSSMPLTEPSSPYVNSLRLARTLVHGKLADVLKYNGYPFADCDEYQYQSKDEFVLICIGGGAAYSAAYSHGVMEVGIEWDPDYPRTSFSIASKLFHEILLFVYSKEFFDEMDKMFEWVDKTMNECLALRGRGIQRYDTYQYHSGRSKELLIEIECKHYSGEYHNLLVEMEFITTEKGWRPGTLAQALP